MKNGAGTIETVTAGVDRLLKELLDKKDSKDDSVAGDHALSVKEALCEIRQLLEESKKQQEAKNEGSTCGDTSGNVYRVRIKVIMLIGRRDDDSVEDTTPPIRGSIGAVRFT